MPAVQSREHISFSHNPSQEWTAEYGMQFVRRLEQVLQRLEQRIETLQDQVAALTDSINTLEAR